MNKEDKIKKNVAEMRSQWESWKSRDDMTFSRFVQLKNGPELSEEETIKNLCEARLKVRNHEDVFDSCGGKNGFTQLEGDDASDQQQYINDEADGNDDALYLACEI